MLPICRMILACAVAITLTGCALFEDRSQPVMVYGPREQLYFSDFDEVWRAVNLVLQNYPLRVSNMDQGTIETDLIRGDKVWTPIHKKEGGKSSLAYQLIIRVIKGKLEGKKATKVVLLKESSVQADFFSDPKQIPSDGFEERTLLYRIGREIQIERALAKAQKKTES